MKIVGCESFAVTVSYEDKMRGTHVVLRLRTDEGVEGVAYVSRVGPRNMRATLASLDAMVEAIVGRNPLDQEGIRQTLIGGNLGAPVAGLELRVASAIDV